MGTRLRTPVLLAGVAALVLVSTLAPLVASQAPSSTVKLRRFANPVETTIDGRTAYCVEVSTAMRVCDVEQADAGFRLTLFAEGRAAILADGRWGVYRGMFSLLVADLDADGAEELIAVDHLSTTNGMAMTMDRLTVIADSASSRRSWISFGVAEYGDGSGTFVTRSDRPGTWILATEWSRSDTLDPQRGYGSYIVGRWFRYQKGRLIADARPLVRRLLNSLDQERSAAAPAQPYSWLMNGKGRIPERDPALGSGEVLGIVRGTIDRVTDENGYSAFHLRLADGRAVNAKIFGEAPDERIDHIGLSGERILPSGVPPSAVVGDVTGRTVRLTRYKDGTKELRVLWID